MVRLHAQWNRMKQLILSKEKTQSLQPAAPRHSMKPCGTVTCRVRLIRSRVTWSRRQDLIGAESG